MLGALEASQRTGGTPAERFRAGLRAYVGFGLAQSDAYRLTFCAPSQCDTIQAADHSFAILQQGVEEMMEAGLFRPGPSGPAAEAVWACLHGLTALLVDQAQHLSTPREHLIDQVLDIAIAGLR